MEERKNNTGLVVLITVLVMLVLGMGAFIIYDKVISKTNEPNSEENNKVDNNDKITYTDYDLDEAKKLVDKYYIEFPGFAELSTFDEFDEKSKICIAEKHIDDSARKYVDCTKVYGQDKFQVESLSYGTCWNEATTSINYEDFNKVYQSLFNDKLEKKDIVYKSCIVDYNESNNEFIFLEFQGGGDSTDTRIYDVLSAKLINGNELTVEVGYVVFECKDTDGYVENQSCSPDFDKTIKYTYNQLHKNGFEQQFIKQYANELKVLTFNFVKENNDFVLKSFSNN